MFKERIRALCARCRLPEPWSGPDGRMVMTLAGSPRVDLSAAPGGMLMESFVAVLPPDGGERERFCRAALTLSLGRTPRESRKLPLVCLAVVDEQLVLQMRVDVDWADSSERAARAFEEALEHFLNHAETWRRRLEDIRPAPRRTVSSGFFPLVCACLALLLAAPAWAAPFRRTAEAEPLAEVLCAYAASRGKNCEVDPAVQGTLSGELLFENDEEFLRFLEYNQGVVAYENGSALFFAPRSELRTEMFPLRGTSVAAVRQGLKDMDAYDARYPLKSVGDGRMLQLTAPPAYLATAAELLDGLAPGNTPVERGVRVFRLRHAWADDITLNFMDQDVVVPGVASLLRRLTGDGAELPTAGRQSGGAHRLKGLGLARQGGPRENSPHIPRLAAPPLGSDAGYASDVTEEEPGRAARIMADARLNAVIIWDEVSRMPYYENIVKELDLPAGLVEIRAAIIDVSINNLTELGLAWGASTRNASGMNVIGGINADSEADFQSMEGSGLNISTIFVNGLDMFMNRVRALEQRGDASVLSRPAVLTMDNIQAVLEVTNTFYVQVPGTYEVDLFDVTYGTVLRVTPHIVRDEQGTTSVKLVVHIEDGGSRAAPKDSGVSLPVVSRTTISTQAVVGESQALIIGGHYYETSTGGESGVPVLMDIPGLGHLFKTQSGETQKQERLFVISPRLVDIAELPDRLDQARREQQERLREAMDRAMPQALPRVGCTRVR